MYNELIHNSSQNPKARLGMDIGREGGRTEGERKRERKNERRNPEYY